MRIAVAKEAQIPVFKYARAVVFFVAHVIEPQGMHLTFC